MEIVILAVVIAVVVVGAIGGLVVGSRKKKQLPEAKAPSATPTITAPPAEPHVGDEAETPRDEARRTIEEVDLPVAEPSASAPVTTEEPAAPPAPEIETPEPTAGRLVRLRTRLSRSQNALGKGLLTLLSREHLDEAAALAAGFAAHCSGETLAMARSASASKVRFQQGCFARIAIASSCRPRSLYAATSVLPASARPGDRRYGTGVAHPGSGAHVG